MLGDYDRYWNGSAGGPLRTYNVTAMTFLSSVVNNQYSLRVGDSLFRNQSYTITVSVYQIGKNGLTSAAAVGSFTVALGVKGRPATAALRTPALLGCTSGSSRGSVVIHYAPPATVDGVLLHIQDVRGRTLWQAYRKNDGGVQSAVWNAGRAGVGEVCVLTMRTVDRSGRKARSLTSVLTRLP